MKKEESAQTFFIKEESAQKSTMDKFVQSSIDKDHFKFKIGGPSTSAHSSASNYQIRENFKRGGSTKSAAIPYPICRTEDSDRKEDPKKRNSSTSEQINIDYSFAEERIAMQRKISDLELAVCRMSDQSIESTIVLEKQVQELKAENACLKQALEATLSKVRQWNQEMIRAGMQNGL